MRRISRIGSSEGLEGGPYLLGPGLPHRGYMYAISSNMTA
jgi:hypothetical protein